MTDAQLDVGAVAEDGAGASDAAAIARGSSGELPFDRAIEAILIVAEEPQSASDIAVALSAKISDVEQALARIRDDYDGAAPGAIERGFELRFVGAGWRIYVRDRYSEVVADYTSTQQPAKLSQAALETLAVIAYRQPISRGGVASIRAVNVDSVVRTLLARGLVEEAGHEDITGATLYSTTPKLLEVLGIASLGELPAISPLLDDGSDGFAQEERR